MNSRKLLIIFVDNQLEWLRDWMVKGGVDYIITNNQKTWKILTNDPILKFKKKIIYIDDINQLNNVLIQLYTKHYGKK